MRIAGQAITDHADHQRRQQMTAPVCCCRYMPASPALFTLDASENGAEGCCPQPRLKHKFSVKIAPAGGGTLVALYATGAGQTNPPGMDGRKLWVLFYLSQFCPSLCK